LQKRVVFAPPSLAISRATKRARCSKSGLREHYTLLQAAIIPESQIFNAVD
jgi:hypothetical protein